MISILSSRRPARVKALTPLRRLLFAAPLVFACVVCAGCDAQPTPPAQTNGAANGGARANDNANAKAATADRDKPERAAAHPIFNPTEEQISKAFAEGEALAKGSGKEPFGEGKVFDVPVQGHKALKLSIFFMPPLAEARNKGYQFGKRPGGTAADRVELIGLIKKKLNRDVMFFADLPVSAEVQHDDNASLPDINLEVLDQAGKRFGPTEPTGFGIPSSHDLLDTNERWIAFPLQGETGPRITDKMDKLTLVVHVGDDEQQVVFNLK